MKRQFIAEEWNKFASQAFKNKSISAAQRHDMRMSFFLGASVIFSLLVDGVSEGDEIREADLKLMSDIQSEVDAFKIELKRNLPR